jgi:hypothetical protein
MEYMQVLGADTAIQTLGCDKLEAGRGLLSGIECCKGTSAGLLVHWLFIQNIQPLQRQCALSGIR